MSDSDSDDFDVSLFGTAYNPSSRLRSSTTNNNSSKTLYSMEKPNLAPTRSSHSNNFVLDLSPDTSPVGKAPLRSTLKFELDLQKLEYLDKSRKLRQELEEEKRKAEEKSKLREEENKQIVVHLSQFARNDEKYVAWVRKRARAIKNGGTKIDDLKDFYFIRPRQGQITDLVENLNLFEDISMLCEGVKSRSLTIEQFVESDDLNEVLNFEVSVEDLKMNNITQLSSLLDKLGLNLEILSKPRTQLFPVGEDQLSLNPKYQLPEWKLELLQAKLITIIKHIAASTPSVELISFLVSVIGLTLIDSNFSSRSIRSESYFQTFLQLTEMTTTEKIVSNWVELTSDSKVMKRVLEFCVFGINYYSSTTPNGKIVDKFQSVLFGVSYVLIMRILEHFESLNSTGSEPERKKRLIDSIISEEQQQEQAEDKGTDIDTASSLSQDESQESSQDLSTSTPNTTTRVPQQASSSMITIPATSQSHEYLALIIPRLTKLSIPRNSTESGFLQLLNLFQYLRHFINLNLQVSQYKQLRKTLDILNQTMRITTGSLNGSRLRGVIKECCGLIEDVFYQHLQVLDQQPVVSGDRVSEGLVLQRVNRLSGDQRVQVVLLVNVSTPDRLSRGWVVQSDGDTGSGLALLDGIDRLVVDFQRGNLT
ncbi:hypothetical protein WICPIJ_007956 [Wickerhamomyces pijperi]|uniref:Uncharacterized protein n=1 Tax=Wickerhamomyces pijperi TaxID=599730 RepID=A0A9P8TJZ3_WICPI|nr:hypothetical protein WICPIJ_007956 [Wickerhamomyces pijperi]